MLPAYFPFTFMSPLSLGRLVTCFGPVALYRPSLLNLPDHLQAAADQGNIQLRIPVSGDEADVENRLRAYRDWAHAHAGAETGWFKAGVDPVPFADHSSTSAIRGDLRRAMEGREREHRPDPLAAARLFLEIAQDRDQRQWDVVQDMARLDAMEKELYGQLRPGEDCQKPVVDAHEADPGRIMIRQRMAAWARLVLAQGTLEPRWLVTDSQEAVQWVLEHVAGSVPVAGGHPVFFPLETPSSEQQRALADYVRALTVAEEEPGRPDFPEQCQDEPCLRAVFFRVPGQSLRGLVNGWMSETTPSEAGPAGGDPAKHAVFAQVQAGSCARRR